MRSAAEIRDVDWKTWSREYQRIARSLALDQDKDRNATRLLHAAMEPRQGEVASALDDVIPCIHSKSVVVFGCGPQLDEDVDALLPGLTRSEAAKIAADGATSALLERDLIPEVIVTDLDGDLPDIIECSRSGAKVVLHAHGDNIATVLKWLPFLRNVIPVTQTEPTSIVRNFGGFTDGDKCLYLSVAMGASAVFLAGMDFGPVAGPRSKPGVSRINRRRKNTKLKIGLRLIKTLLQRTGLPAYSFPPAPFPNVVEVSPNEVWKVLGEGSA